MTECISEGLYRIPVPLPGNPLRELNSYLLRGRERSLLIDTGFRQEEGRRALFAGLAELDVDPRASFRACICSLRSIPNAADRPAAPAPTITASYISSTCFGLIATIFAQGVTSLRFAGWRVCRCMRGYACLMRMFSMDSVDLCRLGGGVVGRDVMWRLRR